MQKRKRAKAKVIKVEGGFVISRPACPVCGEPPFGFEYCCGCTTKKEIK